MNGMRGLDDHIAGGHYHRYETGMHCANGHRWSVQMASEYGSSEPVDSSETICPECRAEGEFDE